MSSVDRSKLMFTKKGFQFKPFRPKPSDGILLREANLSANLDLITFERNGQQRALIMREMAYHHICQGELAGEPYLITF